MLCSLNKMLWAAFQVNTFRSILVFLRKTQNFVIWIIIIYSSGLCGHIQNVAVLVIESMLQGIHEHIYFMYCQINS